MSDSIKSWQCLRANYISFSLTNQSSHSSLSRPPFFLVWFVFLRRKETPQINLGLSVCSAQRGSVSKSAFLCSFVSRGPRQTSYTWRTGGGTVDCFINLSCTYSIQSFPWYSFLFLRLTTGLHHVVNRLYLLWWSLVLIIDFDTDMPTSWRVFLIWPTAVKGF